MALLVPLADPFEEMIGVAPCGPSGSGDSEADGRGARIPAAIGNDSRFPFPGATYTELFQNRGVLKIVPPD
jgi:hypothetical protein